MHTDILHMYIVQTHAHKHMHTYTHTNFKKPIYVVACMVNISIPQLK